MEILMTQFGSKLQISCKQILASPIQMLILLEAYDSTTSDRYNLAYQLFHDAQNGCQLSLLTYTDQTISDIAMFKDQGLVLVKTSALFGKEWHAEFCVEPDFEKSITLENCEQIVGQCKEQWEAFQRKLKEQWESQFVFDVLECLNNSMPAGQQSFQTPYWTADPLNRLRYEPFDTSTIEFKGDMFGTDDDERIARIMAHRLIDINAWQQFLFDSKLEHVFASDPFAFVAPGLGSAASCRNWVQVLKSKKRFLLDKFLEE